MRQYEVAYSGAFLEQLKLAFAWALVDSFSDSASIKAVLATALIWFEASSRPAKQMNMGLLYWQLAQGRASRT